MLILKKKERKVYRKISQRAKLQLCVFITNEKNWSCWHSKTGGMLAVVNIEALKTTPKKKYFLKFLFQAYFLTKTQQWPI